MRDEVVTMQGSIEPCKREMRGERCGGCGSVGYGELHGWDVRRLRKEIDPECQSSVSHYSHMKDETTAQPIDHHTAANTLSPVSFEC